MSAKNDLEEKLLDKLLGLRYEYRPDILDRASLETNFRAEFSALNQVMLTDTELSRLLDEIVTDTSHYRHDVVNVNRSET